MRADSGSPFACMSRRRLTNLLFVFVLCVPLSSCSPPPGKNSVGSSSKATATHATASATPTSTAAKPPASPTVPVDCPETTGEVHSITYPGGVLHEDVRLVIYLPPCYSSSVERIRSLYLLHGYPKDEWHWETLGVIDLVEEGILAGKWPPVLLILPNLPEPLFTKTDGGPGSYEQEMIESLVPFIDETYRTLGEPHSRVIAGISRGGVWALEIGLRNPDFFNTVVALSPSLSVNHPRTPYDPFGIIGGDTLLPARIFVSGGEGEPSYLEEIKLFAQRLTEAGVEHTFLLTDGNHTDEAWESLLPEVLLFIMGNGG